MHRFELMFFDLDGTLLQDDHWTVSPRTRAALEAAARAGTRLCFATGRCLGLILGDARELSFAYAITSNGAAIDDLRNGQPLLRRCFSPEEARSVCALAARHVDFFELFIDGQVRLAQESFIQLGKRPLPPWHTAYFARSTLPSLPPLQRILEDGVQGLEKLNLNYCPTKAINQLAAALQAQGRYQVISVPEAGVLEATAPGCTKGAGIRWLCEHLGVDPRRAAAFGDGRNDIEMLQAVGCGVAMGNASPDVQAAADAVTAPNGQDGVARFIEQYAL